MNRLLSKPSSAAFLMLGVLAPLCGCAAGKSFSIAMADPGPLQTVLVLGDAGAPGAAAAAGGSVSQVRGPSPVLITASSGGSAAAPKTPAAPVSAAPAQTAAATPPQTISAAVQAVPGIATVQVSTPLVIVASGVASSTTAVQVSSPAIATAATVRLGSARGLAARAKTPLVSVVASAGPARGVRLAVVSAPSAGIAPALTATSAVARAALGPVTPTTLSAPTPGVVTTTANVLKALGTAATKKPKHG